MKQAKRHYVRSPAQVLAANRETARHNTVVMYANQIEGQTGCTRSEALRVAEARVALDELQVEAPAAAPPPGGFTAEDYE